MPWTEFTRRQHSRTGVTVRTFRRWEDRYEADVQRDFTTAALASSPTTGFQPIRVSSRTIT